MRCILSFVLPLLLFFSCKKEVQEPEGNMPKPDYAKMIEGRYYDDESYGIITRVSEMKINMIVDYFGHTYVTYDSIPLTLRGDTIFIVEPNPEINTVFVVKDTLMISSIKEMKLIKK